MSKLYLIIITVLVVALVATFLFPEFFKQIMAGLTGLLGGLLGLFAFKSSDTKEKEKNIKNREQDISKAEKEEERAEEYYNEMKLQNDEDIEKAGEKVEKEDINNPDDAASFLDDVLSNAGSE